MMVEELGRRKVSHGVILSFLLSIAVSVEYRSIVALFFFLNLNESK